VISIVPAHPGFFCIEVISSTDGYICEKHPVIAWKVFVETESDYVTEEKAWAVATPILADCAAGDQHIQYPDGKIINAYEGSYYNNETDFFKHQIEEQEKRKAAKTAKEIK
jgi:hypothetical protein